MSDFGAGACDFHSDFRTEGNDYASDFRDFPGDFSGGFSGEPLTEKQPPEAPRPHRRSRPPPRQSNRGTRAAASNGAADNATP